MYCTLLIVAINDFICKAKNELNEQAHTLPPLFVEHFSEDNFLGYKSHEIAIYDIDHTKMQN